MRARECRPTLGKDGAARDSVATESLPIIPLPTDGAVQLCGVYTDGRAESGGDR